MRKLRKNKNLMESFARLAFRVEGLPEYTVNGGPSPSMIEYLRGGQIPSGHNEQWHQLVKAAVSRGAAVNRLRLVSDTLTDYERYEIAVGYNAGIAEGEQIRVARRSEHPPIDDFWLYDDTTIEWVRYDPRGEYLGVNRKAVTPDIQPVIVAWKKRFDEAQPIGEFRAANGL